MIDEKTRSQMIQEGIALLTRLFMKYEVTRKIPIEVGGGNKLPSAQIHMIEAVGKGYGKTVTALAAYFSITKGAVSQIVSKLHAAGYIVKTRKKGNDKEVILDLTAKGWRAFQCHEKVVEMSMNGVRQIGKDRTERELRCFLEILTEVDETVGAFAAIEPTRGDSLKAFRR